MQVRKLKWSLKDIRVYRWFNSTAVKMWFAFNEVVCVLAADFQVAQYIKVNDLFTV